MSVFHYCKTNVLPHNDARKRGLMGRPRLFHFENVAYSVYTAVVVNDDNIVQCPACASRDVRKEYEIVKYGLIEEYNTTTYLSQCGFCSYSFCFSIGNHVEPLVNTEYEENGGLDNGVLG